MPVNIMGIGLLLDGDLDVALVQLAGGQHGPHLLAGSARSARRRRAVVGRVAGAGGAGHQQVQQPLLGAASGLVLAPAPAPAARTRPMAFSTSSRTMLSTSRP